MNEKIEFAGIHELFDDEVSARVLMKLGKKAAVFCSVQIPKGWEELAGRMVDEISTLTGKKSFHSLSSEWGSLESGVIITRPSGNTITPYDIMDKYRKESHKTCYGCGMPGKRIVLQDIVCVLCSDCLELHRIGNAERTGTWLDNF